MSPRHRLARSIPFWILLVGSIAAAASGALLVVDKIATLTTTITDGSATGIEVYGGQAWVTLGAALVGAGLIGLVAVLALTIAVSVVPTPAMEVVEPLDGAEEVEPEAGPVVDTTVAEPVADPVSDVEAPASADPVRP